jgi:hypothetical protein
MEENDYVGDYVNQMELVAKELSNAIVIIRTN